MRNLRALVACVMGAMLVSSALMAEDNEADIQAQLKDLTMRVNQMSNARNGGAGLGANQLPFIIDGFIDVTGNYNFNRSPSRNSRGRAYDADADTFLLNVAHIALHKEAKKGSVLGFNLEIDAGSDARANNATKGQKNAAFTSTSTADMFDLQEANVTFLAPQHDKCGVQIGKFATWEGIEVIENTGNPVISRGFLFLYAEPLNHVGVNAFYNGDVGNDMTFQIKVGVVNGWDLESDNNTDKTLIWLFGVEKKDLFEAHFNGTWGDEQTATTGTTGHKAGNPRLSLDLTGSVTVPGGLAKIFFQVNGGQEKDARANAKHVHWFGLGIQPVVDLKNQLPGAKIAARFELFDDHDGQRIDALGTNEPLTVYNVTICPSYTYGDCTVRFEYRYDWSNLNRGQNARAFEDEDGNADLDHQSTAMIEFLYVFSTAAAE